MHYHVVLNIIKYNYFSNIYIILFTNFNLNTMPVRNYYILPTENV